MPSNGSHAPSRPAGQVALVARTGYHLSVNALATWANMRTTLPDDDPLDYPPTSRTWLTSSAEHIEPLLVTTRPPTGVGKCSKARAAVGNSCPKRGADGGCQIVQLATA